MLSLPTMRGPGGTGDLAAAGWIAPSWQRPAPVRGQNFAADLPASRTCRMRRIGYLPGRCPS